MKTYCILLFSIFITGSTIAQELSATLVHESKIADNGLFFDGTKEVNYHFSPRISPHGDCIDVVNDYVFVTWYKGGIDQRNLMLSRKKLDDPNASWITIEFPHKHIGYRGNPAIGDSHNTAAIGVSTIDGTIHILYDMHAYSATSYPDDFFNYSVSKKNMAFVPDSEFNLSIFNAKQNHLNLGENYERITYPMLHRADDGSLVARYRIGGSGNGDIFMAHYDGNEWTNNWLFSDGTIPLPDRYSLYGGEKILNGKFFSGFSIRYADNDNYGLNSGLYFAYTNAVLKDQSNIWLDALGNNVSLPIGIPDGIKIGEPGDDHGTAAAPRTSFDPSFTVTESGAIHMITRVDNINVHYYRGSAETTFSSSAGGLIPNPQVRGDIFSYEDNVLMVELLGGKPVIKTTPEGQNNWATAYSGIEEPRRFKHFDAFIEEDRLYVYLMEDIDGDACPLYLQVFSFSDSDTTGGNGETLIKIEAEDYDTGGQGAGYMDATSGNSGGAYRNDDVDIEVKASASNGHSITSFSGGEWLKYTIEVADAGLYDFKYVAANRNRDDAVVDVEINGITYKDQLVTRTFDWDVFLPSTIPNIMLNQGENIVIITQRTSLSNNPDKIEFTSTTTSTKERILQDISIYPNPSNGIFHIVSSITNLNYAIISMQGEIIQLGRLKDNTVNVSDFPSGIYLLKLTSADKAVVKKIIIK